MPNQPSPKETNYSCNIFVLLNNLRVITINLSIIMNLNLNCNSYFIVMCDCFRHDQTSSLSLYHLLTVITSCRFRFVNINARWLICHIPLHNFIINITNPCRRDINTENRNIWTNNKLQNESY